MDDCTQEKPSCLRRRTMGMDVPMNLEVGFKIVEGETVIKGANSPSTTRVFTNDDTKPSSSLMEFRKKQQSFEIHIEDCDEEEMSGDESDEESGLDIATDRPHTPANALQMTDYSGNVSYTEQPPKENFLNVTAREQECLTDMSEGESDNEDVIEDYTNLPESVIKKVPS